MLQQMHGLGKVLHNLRCLVRERLSISLTTEVNSFKPGDWVWIKEWNLQPLQPWWSQGDRDHPVDPSHPSDEGNS
jgi:hypothetical protein